MKAPKFWSIFRENRTIPFRKAPSALGDLFVFAALCVMICFPDRSAVLARIFAIDTLFAFDADLAAPAWAFYKGCLLNIDVNSRYGIGIPIFAATFCRMIGHFSYESILLFIHLATVVYVFACYRFLRAWTGHRWLTVAGLVLILKFRLDNHFELPVHPSGTVLRHYFDVFFFMCLWKHVSAVKPTSGSQPHTQKKEEGGAYLCAAAAIVGLAFFAMVDTGIYLYGTLVVYLLLVQWTAPPSTFPGKWLRLTAVALFPMAVSLSLLAWFSGGKLGLLLSNTFEFSRLFRAGFGSIPFWENAGDVLPFALGLLIPFLLLASFCFVAVFVRMGYCPVKTLLTAAIAFYGLGCWHYYICRPYVGSMNYFCVPVIWVFCFWAQVVLSRIAAPASQWAAVALTVTASFLLVTSPRFAGSPYIFNLSRDKFQDEQTRMKKSFIQDKDVRLIQELTRPDEGVAILGSFETALLIRADRRPFFYYTPLLQNAPADTPDFYAMYTATKKSVEKTIREIRVKSPRYVFMERKIYERRIQEHLPFMFEPMFYLQQAVIFQDYLYDREGQNFVALKHRSINDRR